MRRIVFLISAILLLSGCGVDRISIKLSDIEYEGTESGFKVRTSNYTDIYINQAPGPAATFESHDVALPPPGPLLISTVELNITDNVSNISVNKSLYKAEVDNATIIIS